MVPWLIRDREGVPMSGSCCSFCIEGRSTKSPGKKRKCVIRKVMEGWMHRLADGLKNRIWSVLESLYVRSAWRAILIGLSSDVFSFLRSKSVGVQIIIKRLSYKWQISSKMFNYRAIAGEIPAPVSKGNWKALRICEVLESIVLLSSFSTISLGVIDFLWNITQHLIRGGMFKEGIGLWVITNLLKVSYMPWKLWTQKNSAQNIPDICILYAHYGYDDLPEVLNIVCFCQPVFRRFHLSVLLFLQVPWILLGNLMNEWEMDNSRKVTKKWPYYSPDIWFFRA